MTMQLDMNEIPKSLLYASNPDLMRGLGVITQLHGRHLPQGLDQNSALLVMLAGIEYGFHPIQSLQKFFFIGGRVTPSANTLVEMATSKGLRIVPIVDTDTIWEAQFSRHDAPSMVMRYTIQEAEKAGLTKSGTWKSHPRWMLRARCVSAAIRLYAPDLVNGIEYTAEELTNGAGRMDDNGGFVPDADVQGQQPAADFKPFEGRKEAAAPERVNVAPKKGQAQQPQAPVSSPALAEAEPAEEERPDPMLTAQGSIKIASAAGQVDYKATIKNLFAALIKKTGSQDAAKAKAAEFLGECGVSSARELQGSVRFVQFYKLVDNFCSAEAKEAAATAAQATGESDLDGRIESVFLELSAAGSEQAAAKVIADNGYDAGASAAVKRETLRALEELRAAAA